MERMERMESVIERVGLVRWELKEGGDMFMGVRSRLPSHVLLWEPDLLRMEARGCQWKIRRVAFLPEVVKSRRYCEKWSGGPATGFGEVWHSLVGGRRRCAGVWVVEMSREL